MTKIYLIDSEDNLHVMDMPETAEDVILAVNRKEGQRFFPGVNGSLYARQQGKSVIVTCSNDRSWMPHPALTRKQMVVLQLLGEGLTHAQIAFRLGLKVRTVRGHVASLKQKMNAQNMQHLLVKAVALGYIQPGLDEDREN